MTPTPRPATLLHPDVEVRVSRRRKKTAGAHWEGDRIVVVVPTHLRGAERDEMVDHLTRRLTRHRPHLHASDDELAARARQLGRAHLDGVEPSSIRWATNQTKRWGSCTLATREIRISSRLRVVPPWVLDAVVVHELAHLLEPGHTARFRELESRYPRRREADVFLEGYALGLHMDVPTGIDPDDPADADGPVVAAGLPGGPNGDAPPNPAGATPPR
jgi:predicted metal-dependent hydrolase